MGPSRPGTKNHQPPPETASNRPLAAPECALYPRRPPRAPSLAGMKIPTPAGFSIFIKSTLRLRPRASLGPTTRLPGQYQNAAPDTVGLPDPVGLPATRLSG